MTEIDELIKQAEAILKRKPKVVMNQSSNYNTWQELLDGKPYPHIRYGKL